METFPFKLTRKKTQEDPDSTIFKALVVRRGSTPVMYYLLNYIL